MTSLFDRSPRYASNATPIVDEGGELRARLIASHVLVPLPEPGSEWHSREPVRIELDKAGFRSAAREQVKAHGINGAREIANRLETDARLSAEIQTLLAMPPATRDRVLGRAKRSHNSRE